MERLDDSELTTHEPAPAQPAPTVTEIKADITEKQGELQQTLAEIQQRLSPAHLAEQAKATVHDATVGRVTNMVEHVGEKASRMMSEARRATAEMAEPMRQNPWPLALIGVGIAWYVANIRSQPSHRGWQRDDEWDIDPYESNAASPAYSDYAEYPANVAGRSARLAGTAATDLGRRVRDARRSSQDRLGQAIQDNPFVAGVVALAAGALIGTVMPRTDVEDRYLGEARDNVLDSARAIAEDNVQRLSKAVAGEQTSVSTKDAPSAFTS